MRNLLYQSLFLCIISFLLLLTLFINFPQKPDVFPDLPAIKEPFKKEDRTILKPALSSSNVKENADKLSLPLFYLIIDDVGSDKAQLDSFLELQFPLTFAIMPYTKTSSKSYQEIIRKNQEAIIHMPMEPLSHITAGHNQINVGDSPQEIYNKLNNVFKDFPHIKGFNNHMGSAVTSDYKTLLSILEYSQSHSLFFIDSFTTAQSVSSVIAKEKNLTIPKRDVFLDNEPNIHKISENIDKALKIAYAKGHVIVIGHVWSSELYYVLKQREEELKNKVQFKYISYYFQESL